jgi:hypothetical protein
MGSGIRGAKRERLVAGSIIALVSVLFLLHSSLLPLSLSFPSARFGPAFFKSEMSDSRPFTSTPPYPRTHHSSLSLSEEALVMEVNNTNTGEGGAPTKRPRLLRDMQLHGPSGAESVPLVGSAVRGHPSPPRHSISSPPRVSTACVYSTSLEFGDGSIVAELKSAYIAECHNTLHCDYLMKLGNTKGH